MTYDEELLTILMEECAEVQQVASKIIRFGWASIHPVGGPDNRERLAKELGDLQQMVEILHGCDRISFEELDKYSEEKRKKLMVYSSLFDGS